MGVERMLLVEDQQGVASEAEPLYDAFVVTMGAAARIEGAKLVRELRENGLRADLDHAARSMKSQFKYADKIAAKRVVVVAEEELSRNAVKLRDMENGLEAEVARENIVNILLEMKGE
jgi:histidyl-tRNA synthetase